MVSLIAYCLVVVGCGDNNNESDGVIKSVLLEVIGNDDMG